MSEYKNDGQGRALDWEDSIEKEASGFILLPEGDYEFTVQRFERQRHPGSAKLPPCNKAVVYLEVETPQGTAVIRHNLFLHTKCEGILCAFFASIGQRRHGERQQMDWTRVTGARGRCRVGVRSWTGDDGKEHESNEVKRFLEAEPGAAPTAPAFRRGEF